MTCKSSAIKALSCILILLSVIIFVNWIIAYVGDLDDYSWIFGIYYARNAGYWFDGLWVGPILVSGIVGKQNLLSSKRCAHFLQSNHLLFSPACIPILSASVSDHHHSKKVHICRTDDRLWRHCLQEDRSACHW